MGKKKDRVPTSFHENGETFTDPTVIADKFNDYFVNIGQSISRSIPGSIKSSQYYCKTNHVKSLFLSPVDVCEVIKISKSLISNASSGVDNVSNKVVKPVINSIVLPLVHIFNLSFSTGKVPSKLKRSKVVPVFKKNDPSKFTNYRPISLLPCFSKIIERLMYNRLYKFLTFNNLLNNSQFGFRANHSCEHILLKVQQRILDSFHCNKCLIGVFLDLSKAFDTMDHSILLCKLKQYGIRGIALDWFSDYLSNRTQFTHVNNASSTVLNVSIGVPQGSVLGPLLFLIYINDFPNSSDLLSFYQFADDTSIFYSSNTLANTVNVLNSELIKVSDWLRANKLSLNIAKTKCIYFEKKGNTRINISINNNNNNNINDISINNNLNICINNNQILPCSSVNFLGITINRHLVWNDHINNILLKLKRNTGLISRLKYTLLKENLKTLYDSLIVSYLNYCNIIWATSANQCDLSKLFKVQKKCLRIVSNSHYLAESKPIFYDLSLLNIFDINKLQIGTFMYKYEKQILPDIFLNSFQYNSQIHNYNTRSATKFHLWTKSLSHIGPQTWNSIPTGITSAPFQSTFKRKYKQFLLKQYK